MFRKNFQHQLQIFPEDKEIKETKSSNLINLLSKYEKRIKLSIIFIISLLITYSIGIEKGKKIMQAERKENLISAEYKEPKLITPEEIREIESKKDEIQEVKGYIIQVATYRKIPHAEKEVKNLKKKGYQSFTKKIGDFIVVYVGNFQSKDEAKIYLKRLKNYYSDCFIRKL